MSHNVTIRFDFSDTSKYASIPLYIGVSATFTTIFIYIQSELSPLIEHLRKKQDLKIVSFLGQNDCQKQERRRDEKHHLQYNQKHKNSLISIYQKTANLYSVNITRSANTIRLFPEK